jgi:hypothetical protein
MKIAESTGTTGSPLSTLSSSQIHPAGGPPLGPSESSASGGRRATEERITWAVEGYGLFSARTDGPSPPDAAESAQRLGLQSSAVTSAPSRIDLYSGKHVCNRYMSVNG